MRTTIGPWLIECDPEATRRSYAAMGERYSCDCTPCRNFAALGPAAFPPRAHEVLKELGIDFYRPSEIYHISRLKSGLQHYGGWYRCVGHIESGPGAEAPEISSESERFPTAVVTEHFYFWCSSKRELAPKPFDNLPLVQVDFYAELPWVLPEAEPE